MAKVETSPPSSCSPFKRSLNYPDTVENDLCDHPLRPTPVYLVDERRNKWTGVQFRRSSNYKENQDQLAPFSSFSLPPSCPPFDHHRPPSYRDHRDHRHEHTYISCDARPRVVSSRFGPAFHLDASSPRRRSIGPSRFSRSRSRRKWRALAPRKKSINLNRGDRARAEG